MHGFGKIQGDGSELFTKWHEVQDMLTVGCARFVGNMVQPSYMKTPIAHGVGTCERALA